jgi:hypothetical protein
MAMSNKTDSISITERHRDDQEHESIGMCLNCGRRITLCGKPFTADIQCSKCLYINAFVDSQQPISGRW